MTIPQLSARPVPEASEYAAEFNATAAAAPATPEESVASAYISDGELLLWLQSKSQEMYSDVREVMGVSTQRSELMQRLTNLKDLVDSGATASEIQVQLNQLRADYAGTQFEGELATLGDEMFPPPLASSSAESQLYEPQGFDKKHREALSGDIQAEADKLGRDDQLALVQIQNLMSNIRETSQLTSNMLSSRDQASNTIVGNIRG